VQQRGERRRLRVELVDRSGERRPGVRHQPLREPRRAPAARRQLGREAGPQAKPHAVAPRQANGCVPEPERGSEGDHLLRDAIGVCARRLQRARDGRHQRRPHRLVLLDE